MVISRLRIIVAFAAAGILAACGGHGLVPTPQEQSAVQSLAVVTPGDQPLSAAPAFHHAFGRFLHDISLTADQQSQIHELFVRFRQAHPPGSAFDRSALMQLHSQILGILTPAQAAQLRRNLEERRRWRSLDLTDDQRTQIHALVMQYRQAHPWGSQPDPQARQALHQAILDVLTPQQRTQLQEPSSGGS